MPTRPPIVLRIARVPGNTGDRTDRDTWTALYEREVDDTVTTIRLRIATDETADIRAARPGRAARSGASERLDRPLPPSPEPVRGQRGRMQPGDWIALASLVLAVVTYVTSVIKDDGGASVTQLVTIIEDLVHERAGQPQPLPQPAGATGPTTGTHSGGHDTVPPGSH